MGITLIWILVAAAAGRGAQEAQECVQKLRSESVEEREAAEEKLKSMGTAAVPELEQAAKHSDLEVAQRAKRILRVIAAMQVLSPRVMKAVPGIEVRLADKEGYTALHAFLEAEEAYGRAHRSGLTREDLEPLALLALRRASASERGELCGHVGNLKLRRSIPDLIAVVRGDDVGSAEWANRALSNMPDPRSLAAVYPLLREERREVRVHGVRILGSWGLPEAAPDVAARLEDPSELVRVAALDSLGALGAADRIPEIARCLRDDSPVVRAAAASSLATLRSESSIPALLRLVKDEELWPRCTAIGALVSLRAPEAVPVLLERLKVVGDRELGEVEEHLKELRAKESVPGLLEQLEGDDPLIRRIALEVLGEIRAEGTIASIAKRLGDVDSSVRGAAIRALRNLEAREWAGGVAERLTDDSVQVRSTAAEALPILGGARFVPALLERLKDDHPQVKGSAIWALGRIGAREGIPKVAELLHEGGPDLQRAVVKALGGMGAREHAADLVPLLTRDRVGYTAAEALVDLRVPAIVPRVAKLLSEKGAHGPALQVLGGLRAREAVPSILPLLRSENADDRASAAEALGEIGDPESVPALIGLLEDKSGRVRAGAVHALGGTAPREVVNRAADLLGDGNSNARARTIDVLAREGTRETAPLVAGLLDDPDRWTAQRAAVALCVLGGRQSVPLILRAGGRSMFCLNALRQPAVWDRLRTKRLEGDWAGTRGLALAQVAREAALVLERPAMEAGPDEPLRIEGWPARIRLLDLLERSVPWKAQAVLEPDRLRILGEVEAREFWESWWKAEERR
jgi:HEAT repeat protein